MQWPWARNNRKVGSRVMVDQVHTCADLRKQIHLDLRIQHPEWVQADGESPVCDSYEDRLMELLAGLTEMKPISLTIAIAITCNSVRLERSWSWAFGRGTIHFPGCEGAGSTP